MKFANTPRFAIGTACLLACASVLAQTQSQSQGGNGRTEHKQSLSLYAGVLASDNIGRNNGAESRSQTELEVGLFADLRTERERLDARFAADIQYRSGQYERARNELAGGLNTLVEFRALDDRLAWSVEDDFAQSLINAIDVATAENTQNLNVLSTGPRITLPLGGLTSVSLDGKWTNVWYQESDFGNDRLTGTVSLERQLGAIGRISLNGQAESVKYRDLPASADYEIKSTYMGISAKGVRTTLQVNGGYTQLSENGNSTGGALVSFAITRLLNSRSQVQVDAGRNFGSSADSLRRDRGFRGVSLNTAPGAVTADPMRSDFASASWSFSGPRSNAAVRGMWRREHHANLTEFNRNESRGELQVARVLGPRLSLDMLAGYSRNRYNLSDVRFSDWDFGAGISWKATQALSLSLRASHTVGSGDSSEGSGTRDYTENRGELRVSYIPRL